MIVAYTMLHYGKDYLAYALRSVAPYIDKHVILYSETPSFGANTDWKCPDSREELQAIAQAELGSKLIWYEGLTQSWQTAATILPDADLIFELDADEIYQPLLVADMLRRYQTGALTAQRYRVPMLHHWRSFNYVCRDAGWPFRLFIPKNEPGDAFYPYHERAMHHFGYARALSDMAYKWQTSAHQSELRPDWWDDVFMRFPERLTDLHPVIRDFWSAEAYPRHLLPDFMKDHSWYNAEVIA